MIVCYTNRKYFLVWCNTVNLLYFNQIYDL